MNTENTKTQEFDYYTVVLPVEFFPDMRVTAKVSIEINDKDVALQSLEYVQRQHPDAHLSGHKWLDLDDELEVWRGQIQKRTSVMREQLNANKDFINGESPSLDIREV